jgi:hypothetical protein
MESHTLQILLAEHTRLRELEKSRTETYNAIVQRCLTVSTAAVGATLLLVEKKMLGADSVDTIATVLVVLLLFGLSSLLSLLGIDCALLELSLRYKKIRAKFIALDPTLEQVFPAGFSSEDAGYRKWSSFRGVVKRALTISGPKTTMVFLNSLLAGGLGSALTWSFGSGARISMGSAFAVVFGVIQSVYASWRYKSLHRHALEGRVNWWI